MYLLTIPCILIPWLGSLGKSSLRLGSLLHTQKNLELFYSSEVFMFLFLCSISERKVLSLLSFCFAGEISTPCTSLKEWKTGPSLPRNFFNIFVVCKRFLVSHSHLHTFKDYCIPPVTLCKEFSVENPCYVPHW